MTPAPRIGGRAMRASRALPGPWMLSTASGSFVVSRTRGWWRPYKGLLTRPGMDVVRVRAWTPQWCADKLVRHAGRPGRHTAPRAYPSSRSTDAGAPASTPTNTAPGTPARGGSTP